MVWVLLLVLPALWLAVALRVYALGRRDEARECDLIVVLGARVLPGGAPSRALIARTEQAARLFRRGVAPRLLLSGGVGSNPPAEAEVMQRLAGQLGVPRSACLLEEHSRSTWENAVYCSELIRSMPEPPRVLIVTDPFHLWRARQCFWRQGLSVWLSPAPYRGRGLSRRRIAYWTFREALGLILRPALLFARSPRSV